MKSGTLIFIHKPHWMNATPCGRRLAGDAVNAVVQENRVIVHRRQAASHGPVFAARQRYVEDMMAPPAVRLVSETCMYRTLRVTRTLTRNLIKN